ncbi:MAG TPA: hypothetical protein VNQ34_11625 [Xanthobacteraceae bacterium]|nr:hypothetical protein [Xanthobacteraceae bacterium]
MSRIPNLNIEATLNALNRLAEAMPVDALSRLTEIAPERDCYTIDEFCSRNSISRAFYYLLKEEGDGPEEMRLGTKVLITKEAAEAWRTKPRRGTKRETLGKAKG